MKKFAILVIFIVITFFIGYKIHKNTNIALTYDSPFVVIAGKTIKVEVADNPQSRWTGLSYRTSLDKNSGMIFRFEESQKRTFWMKDMNFDLDIIWINNNEVVKIDKNLPPGGIIPDVKYSSVLPVNYVLEVNGGFCDKKKIKVGDKVEMYID